MFLAGESFEDHEKRIRKYLESDPSVSMVVAATYFEWSVARAVRFLSGTPNTVLVERMAKVYGLDKYKDLWNDEVLAYWTEMPKLAEVVSDWSGVKKGFDLRHRVVHGRDRCTRKMATPHIDALLSASRDVQSWCEAQGITFTDRLPVIRRQRAKPARR